MARIAIAAVSLLLSSGAAFGQFKCTDRQGRISFQQTPCAAQESQQAIQLRSAPAPTPAVVASGSVEQRMLPALERERRIRELEQAIAGAENVISNRNAAMNDELSALRYRKSSANNNLAGATWQQSISGEMQAVTTKYKALLEVDVENLKFLREELTAARRAAASK